MPRLIDIEQETQDRVEEILEFLDDAPITITDAIMHDVLYTLAYNSIMDDHTAEAEARRDEEKLEEFYNDED